MAGSGRAVLSTMLDRLLAGLMSGPNMNCRPHASRQRVDLIQLAKLSDATPEAVLHGLLGSDAAARVVARVKPPRKTDEAETAKERAYRDQAALLAKLRVIADEARTYENDTGVAALAVGFPLLSVVPPEGEGKRILAPVAFVPVLLAVKAGATPAVELAGRGEAGDRVRPNAALLAWIEQQTGRAPPADNEDDGDPWGELAGLIAHVAAALDVANPFVAPPSPGTPGEGGGEGDSASGGRSPVEMNPPPNPLPAYRERGPDLAEKRVTPPFAFALQPAPRADEESGEGPNIVPAAVLGLFPVANQGLIRDTRAMMGEASAGPVRPFLTAGIDFDAPPKADAPATVVPAHPVTAPAWLAAAADPCQARAVALARGEGALVVHGPPGTGKSQTITNVIADHLARGERLLLVCEKRTALDVVADRLGHLGLRKLCGIVHDPRRDQRDLYRSIKQQLDELPEARTKPQAQGQLARVDADLRAVHDELMAYHRALMASAGEGAASFSDLVGQWLSLENDPGVRLDEGTGVTVVAVAAHRAALLEAFERARAVELPRNPWAKCGGASLADYLGRPMAAVRTALARCVAAAEAADAVNDAAIPPFNAAVPLAEQGRARAAWGAGLAELLPEVRAAGLAGWAGREGAAVRAAADKVDGTAAAVQDVADHPLDVELQSAGVPAIDLAQQVAAVAAYLAVAGSWSGTFAFSVKGLAKRVLSRYGLPLDRASAERVAAYLSGVRTRATLAAVRAELVGGKEPGQPSDEQLLQLQAAADWLAHLRQLWDVPALEGLAAAVARGVSDATATEALLAGLERSPARAEAVGRLEEELLGAGLFGPAWLADLGAGLRAGEPAAVAVSALAGRVGSLEGVLRVREARAALPEELGAAVDALIARGVEPAVAVAVLERLAVEGEIARRLRADPNLQRVDGRRVESAFEQYRQLAERRRQLVRDAVEHLWVSRQKDRLLAVAGTRLNGVGADLKRRLTSRGERATRLRQVVAQGEAVAGGDPLMDLCPVWMASPETVAQVFPRRPLFDVVIFDEASQCRLEEALPVLTRGKRAVIAGDPHQLPPPRFFESGLVRSGEDEDEGDEQSLFEAHQAQVEDLLSAALNLSVRQCYLDVHYRSRSAELIAFSNQHFYNRRLVPIPSHPDRVADGPAVLMHRVGGIYENRCNPAEADAVVAIVRELLGRAEPPSVGVACLNLPQRDLIVERLDAAAAADAPFAKQLASARARSGSGASDGLFVKNLENVQGDERDEIIISTTYGPRPDGAFHRRFGPLGMVGGGRRLNVLVTRARDRVHLVTSIPSEAYRALPPVPDGQQAGGAWLLFAYLQYAEAVGAGGANVQHSTSNAQLAEAEGATNIALPLNVERSTLNVERLPSVHLTRYPSVLAERLAATLAAGGTGATLYWGNDGFCVDLALHGPGGGMTAGVLVDGCRYAAAEDPVDWDVFRTGVLAGQGWRLTRVWSPHLFRDVEGGVKALGEAAGTR